MNTNETHVLLTGAGKRLGRTIAEALLPSRIKLTAHYRSSEKEALDLVAECKRAGGDAHAVQADLARIETLEKLVASAEKKFGPVDILVNCASEYFSVETMDCTEEQWDHFLDVNLKGQFFLSRACARQMKNRGGVILNLTDTGIHHPYKNHVPYLVSKGGLMMLTTTLAKEWAPKVRVNAISPGPVLAREEYDEEKRKRSSANTLFQRWGTPEDVAAAALFLIENDYVTGFELRVDGGRSV